MTGSSIASHVAIRRRYVRSVDLARDVDDPDALDGYVVTPSVRDAAIRILAGLSATSRQRAFRVVGPYGAGKSAFGVFLAQLVRERCRGSATALLSNATGGPVDITPWRPVIVSGRRVSFARELLRVVTSGCNEESVAAFADLRASAESMLDRDGALDAHAVTALVAEMASELRLRTGEGLLLLVDEMGRLLEHAATNIGTEDPFISSHLLSARAGGPVQTLRSSASCTTGSPTTSPVWVNGSRQNGRALRSVTRSYRSAEPLSSRSLCWRVPSSRPNATLLLSDGGQRKFMGRRWTVAFLPRRARMWCRLLPTCTHSIRQCSRRTCFGHTALRPERAITVRLFAVARARQSQAVRSFCYPLWCPTSGTAFRRCSTIWLQPSAAALGTIACAVGPWRSTPWLVQRRSAGRVTRTS